MKCRNWRTEDPERPENPENPEEPKNPEDPEDPERSGISGSLRKRPVRAAPENPEPPENPKRKQPRTQIYAFCPKTTGSAPIYLPCLPAFTHEMPHAPALRTAKHTRLAPKIRIPAFPSGTGRRPLRNIRKIQKIRNIRKNRKLRKLRNPPEPPKPSAPSARITPIICNLTYYNLRHNTHILIINNKLFTLFLARFKIKPYLCSV